MDSEDDAKSTDLLMLATKCRPVDIFEHIQIKALQTVLPILLQIAVEQGNSSLVAYILSVLKQVILYLTLT